MDQIAADNGKTIDGWTVVHGVAGYAAAKIGFGLLSTFAIAVAWEVIEPKVHRNWPGIFPDGTVDSGPNAATDIGAAMIGWYVGATR